MDNKGWTMLDVVFALFLMGLLWSIILPLNWTTYKSKKINLETQEEIDIYRSLEVKIKTCNKTDERIDYENISINELLIKDKDYNINFKKNNLDYILKYDKEKISDKLFKVKLKLMKDNLGSEKEYEDFEFVFYKE